MFKKNLNNSFLQRVSHRIIDTYREKVLQQKKHVKHTLFKLFFGTFSLAMISLIGYFKIDSSFIHELSLFGLYISSLCLISIPILVIYFYFEFKKSLNLDRLYTASPQSVFNYFFSRLWNVGENLMKLNKEEMNELFHLPLTSSQVTYFQQIILKKNYLDYADLCNIPDPIHIQLEKQQQHLNNFFSHHEIESDHSVLISSLSPEIEKEETIASRL